MTRKVRRIPESWNASRPTMLTMAIQGAGGRIIGAPGSVEKVKPVARKLLAIDNGHSSTHAIERVSSLKVNRPRSKSLISHCIRSLIQNLSGMIQSLGYFTKKGVSSLFRYNRMTRQKITVNGSQSPQRNLTGASGIGIDCIVSTSRQALCLRAHSEQIVGQSLQ